ncbi:MAG: uroporphyrinogen-III synthase, partial [Pseudomonadota bacterium]
MRTLGWAPLISPLMRLEPVAAGAPPPDVAAVALTSANGARCAPSDATLRTAPVWAVGEATAAAAREAGFADVRAGPSDAAALARAMLAGGLPPGARVLHLRGEHGTDGFAEALEAAGMRVEARVVYRMTALSALSAEAEAALSGGRIAAAAVYSPRSARLLARAAARFDLSRVAAAAISEAAATPLRGAGFAAIEVAPTPDGAGMERALDAVMAGAWGDGRGGAPAGDAGGAPGGDAGEDLGGASGGDLERASGGDLERASGGDLERASGEDFDSASGEDLERASGA